MALPHDLQLRRCLPARHQHHPSDPRSLRGDRGAPGIAPRRADPESERLWGDDTPSSDGTGGDRGAASAGNVAGSGVAGPRRLLIRTDGAARGNPGHASCGAALFDNDAADALSQTATPVATISDYLGVATNNVAEYEGVVRALRL